MKLEDIKATLPETVELRVRHKRPEGKHASPKKEMHGKRWITIAQIIDKESKIIISEGRAYCSERDVPSRKLGRTIAVGRAMKNIEDQIEAINLLKDLGLDQDFASQFFDELDKLENDNVSNG